MVRRLAIVTVLCALSIYLLFMTTSAPTQERIPPEEASQHVGKSAIVCGTVASVWHAIESKGAPTFLHIEKPYPHQMLTGIIWDHARARFSSPPEDLQGREVCITGKIALYRGMAQIEVSQPAQIETLRPTR
jgi:DNA/RNA endonuclease YhcR with UshA esterase domain